MQIELNFSDQYFLMHIECGKLEIILFCFAYIYNFVCYFLGLSIMQIALKCADICNPCRTWKITERWGNVVSEEFFRQGMYYIPNYSISHSCLHPPPFL